MVYCDHQENRKSVVGCEHFMEEEELASSSFKVATFSFAGKPGPKIVRNHTKLRPGPAAGFQPVLSKLGGPRAELGPMHCVER